MTELIAGLILFFGVHTIAIVDEDWRNRMAARLGEPAWKGLYALIALIGLVLIIQGYGQTRLAPNQLYLPPPWLRHVALLLMVPVFPLLLAAYIPGRIKARTRHPMLIATLLWAAAHLLVNGSLADLLLFGTFLAWASADLYSLRRRIPRPVPSAPPGRYNDLIAVVAGLSLYAAFVLGVHAWLIDVPAITG